MKSIIDFYNNLDTLNLIIFLGIIIIIILLLIFSIIILNKNKKLKKMININNQKENIKISDSKKDLPILDPYTQNQPINETKESEENLNIEKQPTIESPPFVLEDHIMEYNQDLFSLQNIKKANEYQEKKTEYAKEIQSSVANTKTKPYQKNVLREMSLNQTSPIGIVKPIAKENKIIEKATELNNSLMNNPKEETITQKQEQFNAQPVIVDNQNSQNKKEENNNQNNIIRKNNPSNKYKDNEKYLSEVSQKLSTRANEGPKRTEYELKQEEEAIISYQELMEKKDKINIISEEEAVISIKELLNKKNEQEQEKLYNITKEEDDDNFIKELKNFRNDL